MECNNILVVETILVGGAINSRMSNLRLIHHFLSRDWRVYFRHISIYHNEIIDRTTKIAYSNYNGKRVFTEVSISTKELLKLDINYLADIT